MIYPKSQSNTPAHFHQYVGAAAQPLCGAEHPVDYTPLVNYYREKLADGGLSPARERLMKSELHRLERGAA